MTKIRQHWLNKPNRFRRRVYYYLLTWAKSGKGKGKGEREKGRLSLLSKGTIVTNVLNRRLILCRGKINLHLGIHYSNLRLQCFPFCFRLYLYFPLSFILNERFSPPLIMYIFSCFGKEAFSYKCFSAETQRGLQIYRVLSFVPCELFSISVHTCNFTSCNIRACS